MELGPSHLPCSLPCLSSHLTLFVLASGSTCNNSAHTRARTSSSIPHSFYCIPSLPSCTYLPSYLSSPLLGAAAAASPLTTRAQLFFLLVVLYYFYLSTSVPHSHPCLPYVVLAPHQAKMGSETETITFEGIPFPAEITAGGAGGKPLSLLANGITDIEIHFLQIKYNAIGVYLHTTDDTTLLGHLGAWKGKTAEELLADAAFWAALVSSPVEKLLRVVVIKEIKGSQYGVQLESSVRDRLAAADLYEDEEEEALEKVAEFFQSKYFKPASVITFHFPATPGPAEITFVTEGKGDAKITVENEHVAGMIQKWYLGGENAVSPTTVRSLADRFAALLAVAA